MKPHDKSLYRMGSFGPEDMVQNWISPEGEEDLKSGTYKIISSVDDDDKNCYLQWEWYLEISG